MENEGKGWRGEWRRQGNGIIDEEDGKKTDDSYLCQPHPGLQGYRGEQQQHAA